MPALKKGQNVVLMYCRENNQIVIANDVVEVSGAKITRFKNQRLKFETESLTPSIEKLATMMHLGVLVVSDEAFINAYVKRENELRVHCLARAKEACEKWPTKFNEERIKKYEGDAVLVDLRDIEK